MRRLLIGAAAFVVAGLLPAAADPAAGDGDSRLAIIDRAGHQRILRSAVGVEARAPTWSPDGHLIAFVTGSYGSRFRVFVDARSAKLVSRWNALLGFDQAIPTWDGTGVYIPARQG